MLRMRADRQEEIRVKSQPYMQIDPEKWQKCVEEALLAASAAHQMETTETEGGAMRYQLELRMRDQELLRSRTGSRVSPVFGGQNMTRFVNTDQFGRLILRLNTQQFKFFRHVMFNITQVPQAGDITKKPMRLFLTGGAGVGKQTVIDSITQAVTQHFKYDPNVDINVMRVLLMAPTGKAAFHISAQIIHAALAIPPHTKNNELCGLRGEKLMSLQIKMAHLELIIIDEVSMVGRDMYKHIDRRLRQIMCRDDLFGGLPIIMV